MGIRLKIEWWSVPIVKLKFFLIKAPVNGVMGSYDMANILTLVNRACTRCKMNALKALSGNVDLQAAEFLEYANQAAAEVARFCNWRKLTKDYILTRLPVDNYNYEDSNRTDLIKFPLPQDFDSFLTRFIYDLDRNELLPNQSDDLAMAEYAAKTNTDAPAWRILGNCIVFNNPVSRERRLVLTYKSKNFIATTDENGEKVYSDIFEKDNDVFLLDEEALIKGIMYQKSLAYGDCDLQERKEQFIAYLEFLKSKDNAARITNVYGREKNRISPTDFQRY